MGFHPLVTLGEDENDLRSLSYSISHYLRETIAMVTVWSGLSSIGAFPVGASFLMWGPWKGFVLIGCKPLSIFLRRNSSPSLTSETGTKEQAKGGTSKFLTSGIPQIEDKDGSSQPRTSAGLYYPWSTTPSGKYGLRPY